MCRASLRVCFLPGGADRHCAVKAGHVHRVSVTIGTEGQHTLAAPLCQGAELDEHAGAQTVVFVPAFFHRALNLIGYNSPCMKEYAVWAGEASQFFPELCLP